MPIFEQPTSNRMSTDEKIKNGFVLDLSTRAKTNKNFNSPNRDLEELQLRRKLEQLETKKANREKIEEYQEQKKIEEVVKFMSNDNE